MDTLKALAHNKHNDLTTTYSLLFKKWLNAQSVNSFDTKLREVSDKRIQDQLIILNTKNYEEIARKLVNKEDVKD